MLGVAYVSEMHYLRALLQLVNLRAVLQHRHVHRINGRLQKGKKHRLSHRPEEFSSFPLTSNLRTRIGTTPCCPVAFDRLANLRPLLANRLRPNHQTMSDSNSPVASPAKEPVDDGQEKEFEDEVNAADSDRDEDALSEVDENLIEDYDPEAANIEDRPVDIDEDVARTLKATKRKRAEGEVTKKPREGRRDKKRRDKDEDVAMDDLDADDGAKKPRRARRALGGERPNEAEAGPSDQNNEEELSPEEKRKRAIDRALDAAIKKPTGARRKRKDEIVSLDFEIEVKYLLTMRIGPRG